MNDNGNDIRAGYSLAFARSFRCRQCLTPERYRMTYHPAHSVKFFS